MSSRTYKPPLPSPRPGEPALIERLAHTKRRLTECTGLCQKDGGQLPQFFLAPRRLAWKGKAATSPCSLVEHGHLVHGALPTRQLVEILHFYGLAGQVLPSGRCPGCGRIYWAGSHHAKMVHLLAEPARYQPMPY